MTYLAKLAALEKAASRIPWEHEVGQETVHGAEREWMCIAECRNARNYGPSRWLSHEERDANAALIAAARNALPKLLAVARAAAHLRRRMRTGGGCDMETTKRLGDEIEKAEVALDAALAALEEA